MRKRFCHKLLIAAALVAAVSMTVPGVAHAADVGTPDISEATSAMIIDSAGNTLYAKNEETRMPPASITKIMTAMVALDSGISMDTQVTIPEIDMPENAQAAGYIAGTTTTFGDLMKVMLVYSANDAASAVAITVAGSESAFADLMNQKAAELGMTNTHFVNASGLDADNHYSCAKDLVTMGRYALTHYAFISTYVHTPSVTVNVNGSPETFSTTDELLGNYPGMRGIKTGWGDTGGTFLGACERKNAMVYTVVMGTATKDGRFSDTVDMLNWIYTTYRKDTFAQAGTVYYYAPYAYRFGWVVPVTSATTVQGLVWPAQSDVVWTKVGTAPGTLTLPGETVQVGEWVQDNRVVANTILTAGKPERGVAGNPLTRLVLTGTLGE